MDLSLLSKAMTAVINRRKYFFLIAETMTRVKYIKKWVGRTPAEVLLEVPVRTSGVDEGEVKSLSILFVMGAMDWVKKEKRAHHWTKRKRLRY